MNDIPQHLNTEEEIIYEIVDDIINTENKISEITNSLIINDNSNIGQTQFNLKHQILKNISHLNSLNSELDSKKTALHSLQTSNQSELTSIETQIHQIKSKIKSLSTSNPKEELYRLNYEQIEELITKKKNEDDLKQNYYEFSTYNSQLQNLKLTLSSLQTQYTQIQEQLNLLNEEISSSEDNIINLLSQKESIEELCNILFKIRSVHKNNQNHVGSSNNNINNSNNIFSTVSRYNITTTLANQSELRNIELYHYEICQCNVAKISKDISEIIINYINTSSNATTIQTNTNSILMYEDNNNTSINIMNLPTKNPLLKGQIISLLKTSLASFINLKTKHITPYKVSTYLSNISNKIVLLIPNSNLTQTKISDLLKYMLKIEYFDVIIKHEMNFIDKEYKQIKKSLMKNSNDVHIQIQKIENRIEDFNMKIETLQQKELYLKHNTKDNIYLSPNEKEYIFLNEQLNNLSKNKKSLLQQNEFREDNLNNEILNLQKQIKEITLLNKENEMKLEQINQEIQIQKGNVNEQILALRKNIAEKFKLIKMQLAIFKQKHGNDNMDLYNKLTERINRTLKTTSTNLLNLNYINTNNNITPTSTSNHSSNRNYNNSFLLNNSLNANENESMSCHNKGKNSGSNDMNNLLLSTANSNNTNKNNYKQQYCNNIINNSKNSKHHSSNSSGPYKSNFKINSVVIAQSASMSRLNNHNKGSGGNTSYNFVNVMDNNNKSNHINSNSNNVNKSNFANMHLLHNKIPQNKSATNYFNRTFRQNVSQPIVLKSRNFENLSGNNNKINNKQNNVIRNINYEQVNKSAASQYKNQNNNKSKEQNEDKSNNSMSNNNNLNSSRSNNSFQHSNSGHAILRQPHGVLHSNIKHNNANVIKNINNANSIANYKKLIAKTKQSGNFN